MTPQEQEAILTISLLAAYADGSKDEAEHAAIRRVADGFQVDVINFAGLYQKVLTKEASVATAAPVLTSPDAKALAFEMARCICEANGPVDSAEQAFLTDLGNALALATTPAEAPSLATPTGHEPLDALLLKYSVLTAALELLPQTTGALAILPAQMKLVYDIGKRHGAELDRRSIQDFAAALGIGAVSQVLEAGIRGLLSGVLGSMGSSAGKVGDLTGGVAGTALTFATTYALGTVADRYYASGRQMDLPTLKQEFTTLLEKAKSLQGQYGTAISAKASELKEKFRGMDSGKILNDIFGGRA